MLKKIPISIAAISLVEGLKIHQDEETNVQLDEGSEWNASIAQAKPQNNAAVEIEADQSSIKKNKKHHKAKKHPKTNIDASLIQKEDKQNQVPTKVKNSTALNKNVKKSNKTSIPACTSVEGSCKKESEATNWNVPTSEHPISPDMVYGGNGDGHVQALDQKKGTDKSIPACTSIGCKTESIAKPAGPDYPVDYKVPNNGMDHDIEHSIQHLKDAEKQLGNWDYPPKADAKLQLETNSIPACTSAGCMTATAAPKTKAQLDTHPVDYKVADFGVDKDIIATEKHLKDMEAKFGKWDYKKQQEESVKKASYPIDYKVPTFGADQDIDESMESLKLAEKAMGKKWVVNMQSAADIHLGQKAKVASDPNHGTGDGCFNYNLDGSMAEKCGSKKATHDQDGNPLEDTPVNPVRDLHIYNAHTPGYEITDDFYKYKPTYATAISQAVAQVKSIKSAQPGSDPIHGSGDGCVDYNDNGTIGKKCTSGSSTDHPINYPVPNLGLDKDIVDSQSHEKQAGDGKWAPGSTEAPPAPAKEETKPEAKATEAPETATSLATLADVHMQEKLTALDSNWNPDRDDKGTWMIPTPTSLAGTKIDVHLESDPVCISTGCETRYANPSDEEAWKKIGYSPLDAPLDQDIQDSKASAQEATVTTGKEWSILQTGTEVHTKNSAKAETKAKTVVKAKQAQKSAVKSKAHTKQKIAIKAKTETKQKVVAKAKESLEVHSEAQTEVKAQTHLQTKYEKANEFALMREKMMSNWGFKS